MDSGLQIDNVQRFVEVIGDNDNLWNLLVGREVSRFQAEITYGIKGKVLQIQNIKDQNTKHEEILIEINYKNEFNVKYYKEIFIEIFNTMSPPYIPNYLVKKLFPRSVRAETLYF